MTPRIAGLPWPNETTRYNKRIIAKVVIPITHQNLFTKNQWVCLNMVCIPSAMTTFGRDNMDHDDKPSLCSSEQLPTWPLNITAAVPQSWKAGRWSQSVAKKRGFIMHIILLLFLLLFLLLLFSLLLIVLAIIIEGSLEVKLPTIWTDEKQSRAKAERRERLEERRVEEKESEERRCRCAKR